MKDILNRLKPNTVFFIGTLILASLVLLRLAPLPENMSPIGAFALFGAFFFQKTLRSLLVVFGILFLTDLFLGLHSSMLFVYAGFAVYAFFGRQLRGSFSWTKMFGASLAGSLSFYLISNFGVWVSSGLYAKSFAGLVECYIAAIPFFRGTLAGDLVFASAAFGAYQIARAQVREQGVKSEF